MAWTDADFKILAAGLALGKWNNHTSSVNYVNLKEAIFMLSQSYVNLTDLIIFSTEVLTQDYSNYENEYNVPNARLLDLPTI